MFIFATLRSGPLPSSSYFVFSCACVRIHVCCLSCVLQTLKDGSLFSLMTLEAPKIEEAVQYYQQKVKILIF